MLPVAEFYRERTPRGLRTPCRACRNRRRRTRYQSDPIARAKQTAWTTAWIAAHRGQHNANSRACHQRKVARDGASSKVGRVRNDGRWHNRGSEWSTPQDLYDQLHREFAFTLDVCAAAWNAKHERYFTVTDDALNRAWDNHTCWMNPPYGRSLNQWMAKAFEAARAGATVVCLVPAATDTAWWHDYAMQGEVRFMRGRPRFVTPEGTWQQTFSPSVLVIFRP